MRLLETKLVPVVLAAAGGIDIVSLVSVATIGGVDTSGSCCYQRPYGCPWPVLTLKDRLMSIVHAIPEVQAGLPETTFVSVVSAAT